ncbi:NUDIX domain-containing protein [Loktanella sp. Alg231-35]|uniref:NUDIX domain-containing protein n=1 Tax=Loktanella sp. Alg231-35 TaxID=1922220 RepID=UPI000D55CB32|nr:NUDIX domain-containing protein [Loktanella sp. Alg231-35]
MDIFVYGTLRSHALMAAVAGEGPMTPVEARLPDVAVYPLAGNVVPFIRASPGAAAFGLIWQGLTPAQVARLDVYEGAFGYVLEETTVSTAQGARIVQCYMPPAGLPVGDGAWSLAVWEADHLAPAILGAQEVFSLDPLPDAATLRGMWPMIEARAWSKHRPKAAPAARRFTPSKGDFAVLHAHPPAGRFFSFQSMDVQHRMFSGARSDVLHREGFFGIDAAIVLPYDPKRDRILLVEQARMGPALRHDPNPWMLEPVAGIVDARETPEQAAMREGHEEAGLTFTSLERAGQFYVSPGATTDYFYTYVGLCDLPQSETYLGGLPDEAEDLRLHPMSLDEGLALADSGEIATGPALFLLYWILRHRARLAAV